jgi:hypothetical protein
MKSQRGKWFHWAGLYFSVGGYAGHGERQIARRIKNSGIANDRLAEPARQIGLAAGAGD